MNGRLTRTLIIGAAAFFIQAAATADVFAAADPTKVGVVDPQAVLEKSKAGRRALDALKEYAQARQKLLANDEEELKNLEKQLKDQESGMSEAMKRDKTGQFRNKLQDYQKRAQEFNQELTGKQKELVDEYMKKIGAATRVVAERGGYTVVVDRGSDTTIRIVIYSKDTLDLTDQVIKEFDRQNR